jgi:hypothetical protein
MHHKDQSHQTGSTNFVRCAKVGRCFPGDRLYGPSSGRLAEAGQPAFRGDRRQIDFFAIFPTMFVNPSRSDTQSCMAMEMPIFGLPLNIQIGNEDSVRERAA